MDVFEAIGKRYSYRGGFQPRAIPREDLSKIVQAGLQAPSGCNAQTTAFVAWHAEGAKVLRRTGLVQPLRAGVKTSRTLQAYHCIRG